MNAPTKNHVIILLALTTVGAGALAWHEFLELVGRPADVVGNTAPADTQRQLAASQRYAQELEDQLANLRDADQAADAPGTSAAVTPSSSARGRGGQANFRNAMNNPAAIQLMAQQQRAALDATYASLFKALNLSPAQLNQFKSLLVEKQSTLQDVNAAARTQGIDPRTDPAGFSQLVATAQAGVDANIQSLLGDAAYAQYQQYTQTLPQLNVINRLQQSLSYTDSPLSDTQSTQLLQILANTTTTPASAGARAGAAPTAGGGQFGGGTALITDQTVALAQPVLSTTQLQALQALQQTQQAQQQLRNLISASGHGSPGAQNPPTRGTSGG